MLLCIVKCIINIIHTKASTNNIYKYKSVWGILNYFFKTYKFIKCKVSMNF